MHQRQAKPVLRKLFSPRKARAQLGIGTRRAGVNYALKAGNSVHDLGPNYYHCCLTYNVIFFGITTPLVFLLPWWLPVCIETIILFKIIYFIQHTRKQQT